MNTINFQREADAGQGSGKGSDEAEETSFQYEFEKYPELQQCMQEFASHGYFADWTGFISKLDAALISAARKYAPGSEGEGCMKRMTSHEREILREKMKLAGFYLGQINEIHDGYGKLVDALEKRIAEFEGRDEAQKIAGEAWDAAGSNIVLNSLGMPNVFVKGWKEAKADYLASLSSPQKEGEKGNKG